MGVPVVPRACRKRRGGVLIGVKRGAASLPRAGLRAVPEAKSLQWSDFRREGHESYARMARVAQLGRRPRAAGVGVEQPGTSVSRPPPRLARLAPLAKRVALPARGRVGLVGGNRWR